jgi:hypothetical protein
MAQTAPFVKVVKKQRQLRNIPMDWELYRRLHVMAVHHSQNENGLSYPARKYLSQV